MKSTMRAASWILNAVFAMLALSFLFYALSNALVFAQKFNLIFN